MTKVGNGTVISTPAGTDCGATCSASYDYNTLVTLDAVAGTVTPSPVGVALAEATKPR